MRSLIVHILALALALGTSVVHAAPAADPAPRALVVHVAPQASEPGAPVELYALIDAPFAEALVVAWRPVGEQRWAEVPFERSTAGGWYATLPPAQPPGVEYYIRGNDSAGTTVEHFASAQRPHVVRVDATEADRLEAIDLERLGYLRHRVSLDVSGHDFGNRYGYKDRWLRTEATYTHQMLRAVHHIAFGFGTIDGRTPSYTDVPGDETTSELHQLRYGFGELRFRLHRSAFVDARALLGVSHDGFTGGARGQVTFGKPWRSNVAVGGEYLGDVGGSGFVRLQWDTAWPVMMGASVVKTDLPGARVSRDGLYVAYDLAYRVGRLSFKGQLSLGARDGSAHLGGGLGTALDF